MTRMDGETQPVPLSNNNRKIASSMPTLEILHCCDLRKDPQR